MTIQLNVGLQPLQLPRGASWVTSRLDDKLSKLGELNPLKLQYVSLRDLMEALPTKSGSRKVQDLEWCNLSEIKFKHELLKQAARAYLRPMGSEVTPKAHFLEQCWSNLTAKNWSLFASATAYLLSKGEACMRYLKAQGLGLMLRFKPYYIGFLRMRPRVSV